MGFLSGAYGKLMAGQHLRNLQHRLTQVTSQHRRITREIQQKEKMYQAMERNAKYQMQAQMQGMIQSNLMSYLPNGLNYLNKEGNPNLTEAQQQAFVAMAGLGNGGIGNLANGISLNGGFDSTVSMLYSGIQQQAQLAYTQAQTVYQNLMEMNKEADLQALKDVEDDLQTEKDSLESQIKIAQADYDSKKEEEKAGAKNITPDYTGQG